MEDAELLGAVSALRVDIGGATPSTSQLHYHLLATVRALTASSYPKELSQSAVVWLRPIRFVSRLIPRTTNFAWLALDIFKILREPKS